MDAFEPVKSALRTVEILRAVAKSNMGMTFAELQREMGWPRSSTYNLLQTLTHAGFLELDEVERRYQIGMQLWEVAQAFPRSRDLVRMARPHLAVASSRLNETVQLAILDNVDNVYLSKVEVNHRLMLASEVGSRLPAYATGLGKALLAGLDDVELERRFADVELQPFTEKTIPDKASLFDEIARIRERGYAIDEGELSAGVYCVALPILDISGETVAAISSSVPEARLSDALRDSMVSVLRESANEISSALGHREEGS